MKFLKSTSLAAVFVLSACASISAQRKPLAISDIEGLSYGQLGREQLSSLFGKPDTITPYPEENAEFWDYKDEDEKFGSRTNHVSFWVDSASGKVLVGSFLPRFPDPISTIDQVMAHFPNLKFTLTTEEVRRSDFIDRRDSYLSNDGRVSVS